MKNILTVILIFLCFGCASSQDMKKDFAAFYDKYQDASGVKCFEINCNLGEFIKEDGNNSDLLKKMTGLRFFIAEKNNDNFAQKIANYLPGSVYHDLMVVKEDGSTVVFKIREVQNKDIKEIVMTVSKPDSFVAISFSGHFTYDEAERMSKSIDSKDMEDF